MAYTDPDKVSLSSLNLEEINLQMILQFSCDLIDEDEQTHTVTEDDFTAQEMNRMRENILNRFRSEIALLWNKKQEEE